MNIIISGYGRMGKEVEKVCLKKGYKIIAIIDNETDWQKLSNINCSGAVIIDFSMPKEAINIYLRCFKLGFPIVTGTTGWHKELSYISEQCKKYNGSFFYAPNFSIGVNIFLKANSYLAHIMSKFSNYDPHINETHHIHKIDAPSGTAIAVAEGIINEYKSLNSWTLNNSKDANSLPVYSNREGEITGTHEIVYESTDDKLTLSHEAKNRSGFAIGAVLAAEFIIDKHGIFNMDDLIKQM